MGRTRAKVHNGRDAADELFAVFDVPVVVSRVFVFLHYLPAEKSGIKRSDVIAVGGVEIGPAQSAVRASYAGARIDVRLPIGESGSAGVPQNGHASGIAHVKGRSENGTAEFSGACGRGVRILYGDVKTPVGRYAVLKLFWAKRTGCRCVPAFELEDGVNLVGAYGNVVGGPAENFAVEGCGGGLVG